MKVMPNTTICIANTETVFLELDVTTPIEAVRLVCHDGSSQTCPLAANGFDFPIFCSPNVIKVLWLDDANSKKAVFENTVHVVSRHYFTLSQLRDYGDGQDDFSDILAYPDERLYNARQSAEEMFEHAANRSFIKRIGSTIDYGSDTFITLKHCDVSEVITSGYKLVSDCQVKRNPAACSDYSPHPIEYVYGLDDIPQKVSEAVLTLAAYYLRPSNTADRATGESTDAGYIHYTLAGINGATSLPEVNATAEQFGRQGVSIW